MPKSSQDAYAKLLKDNPFGYALYRPSDVEIGDIGYFRDGAYDRLFNVFDLDREADSSPIAS